MFFEGTLSPSANNLVEFGALQPGPLELGDRPKSGKANGLAVVVDKDTGLLTFCIPSVVEKPNLSGKDSQKRRLLDEPKPGLGVVKAFSAEQLYLVGQQPPAL